METGFCLGSNVGRRLRLLCQAKTRILMEPQVKFAGQSPVYETEPIGVKPEYQALKFLNAVVVVESPYTAEEWLPKIKKIEQDLLRIRTEDRNAPRPMDIDLLFCGDQRVESDLLQVPHARWAERRFVVQPLAEVRPDLVLPGAGGRAVRQVLAEAGGAEGVRLFCRKW